MKAEKNSKIRVEAVKGDITNQPDCEVIVNAANAQLAPGGGVAGAIHQAAGYGLYRECQEMAPIRPGEAVITGGHGLPNKFIVHCLGPRYGLDEPSDDLLASCFRNALRLAEEAGAGSIAFPAISAGAFGYPMAEAAGIAFATIFDELSNLENIRLVRLVLFDDNTLAVFQSALEAARARRGI